VSGTTLIPYPMKSLRFLAPLALLLLFLVSVRAPAESQELFNGRDLTGWETYLGPRYDTEKRNFAGTPIGLNTDPAGVFSVAEIDGAPAIRISGEVFGTLATLAEFENYHLRLQFKWGERRWIPRATSRRDSGLLYHSVGPHAMGWFFWMRSQEFQIQEHDTGDFWAVGGTSIKVQVDRRGTAERPQYFWSPAGKDEVFRPRGNAGERAWRSVDAEKERGQWNTLDLYCLGQTSYHVVNGVLVMILRDSEQPDSNGGWIPLTKGKIQLQSEGAEVFYRAITVEPIDELPNLQVAP
jgi:hypothetical protein